MLNVRYITSAQIVVRQGSEVQLHFENEQRYLSSYLNDV